MSDAYFQLKGSTITVIVLELHQYEPNSFSSQLKKKIIAAPKFFAGSPVLINLGKLTHTDFTVDFSLLIKQCRELGLQPVGFKGVAQKFASAISETVLASLTEASASTNEFALGIT